MNRAVCTDWGGRDWSSYYDAVAGKPPRETLLQAIGVVLGEPGGARVGREGVPRAIDLGAGEGRDTRELVARGFEVVAVDPHPDAGPRLMASLPEGSRVEFVSADVAGLSRRWGDRGRGGFEIVNASFALPFVRPEEFGEAWAFVRGLLASGGVFAGQFFGPRDSWAEIAGRSHHTTEQVRDLLAGLEPLRLDEDERPGHDAEGNAKHWHVFHVVARRGVGGGHDAREMVMNRGRQG